MRRSSLRQARLWRLTAAAKGSPRGMDGGALGALCSGESAPMEDRGEELRRARAQGGARTESRLQPGHKKTELANRIIENDSGYWQKEETEFETNNAMILRVKKLVFVIC